MTSLTVQASAIGAATAFTVFSVSCGIMHTYAPTFFPFTYQGEMAQDEIFTKWMTLSIPATVVGAGLGALAVKTAQYAYQSITGNQQ